MKNRVGTGSSDLTRPANRLVDTTQERTSQALAHLFVTYRTYLQSLARRKLPQSLSAKVDASDIVQDTLLKASRHYRGFERAAPQDVKRWLRRILTNIVIDHVRRRGRLGDRPQREISLDWLRERGRFGEVQSPQSRSPASALVLGEQALHMAGSLAQLPEQYRRVVTLRIRDRLSFPEIGRRLERSPEAARKLWARALRKLQVELEKPTVSGLDCGREFGRFRILEVLGKGGMGTVYKAFHTKLHRLVALKVLAPRWVADADGLARFQSEMRALGALHHPHVVWTMDADERDGVHFLVTEYIDGDDLAALLGRCGSLPISAACEVVRQAALGLEEVHRRGIVHRDVKPSNVMVGRDGCVRLLDLGLALLKWPDREELTKPDQTPGTADYMAPEQLSDPRAVDGRADIYGLGCTLYYALCGQAPFSGGEFSTGGKKLLAHATLPVPSLRQRRADVPKELQAIVERMLAKEPGRRFSTGQAVAEVLTPLALGADLLSLMI